ncbi:MAG: type II toxin-antitoxin system RelE/ParE family toxin [Clostridia bacterium]|nr:type II toxin-antitoxin system RelE/ParE family toxin [Clostridia bacterium]
MENKYELKFLPKAIIDLDNILGYISDELKKPTAATNIINNIFESLDLVCKSPKMYPVYESSYVEETGLRKMTIKNYIVIYRIDEQMNQIQVLRAFNGLQDYEKILYDEDNRNFN